MIPDLFFDSPWPGLVAWVILYISDYSFTLSCARSYRAGVNQTIVFEGSFEITPYFQKDIDQLRIISSRFVFALILTSVWLLGIWWIALQTLPQLYQWGLGAMLLSELAVHVRHMRNFFYFRMIMSGNAIRGRIEYARPAMLRLSSIEMATFAALFGVLFLFTRSWFLFGGAIANASTALKHLKLARRWETASTAPQTEKEKSLQASDLHNFDTGA